MMPDLTGQQFGNYRLVRRLGSGGFASVYLGQHVRITSQQAAIKILHLFGVEAQAFQQEAETTASLIHPHIVRLFDFDLQQGTPFLVMDYAPHGSLRHRHPKGTPLPLTTVVQYVKEIALALHYAHNSNIIHPSRGPWHGRPMGHAWLPALRITLCTCGRLDNGVVVMQGMGDIRLGTAFRWSLSRYICQRQTHLP